MQANNVLRTLLALILAGLPFLTACDGVRSPASGASDTGIGRFEISAARAADKGPGTMIRFDTATGQAWEMGVLAAGPWKPYAEGPDGTPSPGAAAPGRYSLLAFNQPRAGATLVRVGTAIFGERS